MNDFGELMNRYYDLIAEAILRSEGDVNKFCGPEVIAHYGLIKSADESSVISVAKGAIREIGAMLESEFRVQIGTGICRGTVIYGAFGSSERKAFTAFGPPVICAGQLSRRNPRLNTCESVIVESSGIGIAVDDSISVHRHWRPK